MYSPVKFQNPIKKSTFHGYKNAEKLQQFAINDKNVPILIQEFLYFLPNIRSYILKIGIKNRYHKFFHADNQ